MASSVVKAGYWFCGPDSLPVAEIPSKLFTHLYAGFAKVNPDTGGVTFPIQYKEPFEKFTTIVRRRNPEVKTLLSIGGDIDSAANHISLVMKDQSKRKRFIQDTIDLATTFKFQGLDLCWLYPSSTDNDADLGSFLNEWRAAVEPVVKNTTDPLLLTAAVYHHPVIVDPSGSFNYPCDTINEKLDWINILAIDFYTPSNSKGNTGPVHAWRTRPEEPNRCGWHGIERWIANGVGSKKSVLCLPFYGYERNLADQNKFQFFDPAHAARDDPIPYRTIKQKVHSPDYEIVYVEAYIATYAHEKCGINWIGYVDECSVSGKVKEAIRKHNLGGYFAWDVGSDDREDWTLSTAAFNA